MSSNYKDTMNLPTTDFPMRANLATRELNWRKKWDELDIYRQAVARRKDSTPFILHDGPPYANGHIHMGTGYNKILKDMVIKYKTMRGYYSPYVPGWDCHGQPIEHQVEKNLGPARMAEISKADLRTKCRYYAEKWIDIQREEFKRLGVLGDWENPYLTFNHEYEAGNVEVFKRMFLEGSVYRGRKAIHWCMRCGTALAEAEIEYADDTSTSIFVAYRFADSTPWDEQLLGDPASILIWTTTPWTLPANAFVVLNGEAQYCAVRVDGQVLVVAQDLLEKLVDDLDWKDAEVLNGTFSGTELSALSYIQPIHHERVCRIITDPYVDLTTGTGAVHGAGGHGAEDNLMAVKNDIPIYMPVLEDGTFDSGGGPFEGYKVRRDDHMIIEWLIQRGTLVAQAPITHSYPHCWRCKEPVIFRATEQWFVSMDKTGLKEKALEKLDTFRWIPAISSRRMTAMIQDRPDWCISRQRSWGVPIPVHKCSKCGEVVANAGTFDAVIALFNEKGADAWFTDDPRDYLPADTSCANCGCTDLECETDILDVWWESGCSHTSVLVARPELSFPAQMYLEGSDQHRGWFQSAFLTSMGAYGVSPFENLLTHEFTVDGDGKKMSKSIGNTMSPIDITNKLGADIVRLWMASSDYGQSVAISNEILDRTSEAYRRIRNTFRFLLSNLDDFTLDNAVPLDQLDEMDRAELVRLSDVVIAVTAHNDDFKFYLAQREISDYMGELSSTYLDPLKDRLYASAPNWGDRRSAQTVLNEILQVMVRVLAPVLSYTCEEVWEFMPSTLRSGISVHLTDWPAVAAVQNEDDLRSDYDTLRKVRDVITKAIEDARNAKTVGKSQEAVVTLVANKEICSILNRRSQEQLCEFFIVSCVIVNVGITDEVDVVITPSKLSKCPRCWNYRVLSTGKFTDVCQRCDKALTDIGFEA